MTTEGAQSNRSENNTTTCFQIWGARGSRNATGSAIANHTSCYSLAVGEDLYVFDAGSGLLALSAAQRSDKHLARIRRVHIFITHAHWDHWEGLKDAEWFWRKDNGIELSIFGPHEALHAIRTICQPPSFVKLEILAIGTVKSLSVIELQAHTKVQFPSATLLPFPLHHYSGIAPYKQPLCTLGYRLVVETGPTVVYLCDHEPTAETAAMEETALASADLAIVDASYGDISEHAFGHGSIESAAALSRRFPDVQILAAHHGVLRDDEAINAAMERHSCDTEHLSLAVEGRDLTWLAQAHRFCHPLDSVKR